MPLTTRITAALASCALAGLLAAPGALASTEQVSMIEDNTALAADPAGTVAKVRATGATVLKVAVYWNEIAPDPMSPRFPAHFNPADPGDYGNGFAFLDAVVHWATVDGIKVLFNVTGSPNAGAPLWADGPGKPATLHNGTWKPSAAQFKAFVTALGTRYSGHYTPRGDGAPLPRVSMWSIWNEPNYGPELSPQAIDGNTVYEGAVVYRSLLGAAWQALGATGHRVGSDTILIGELAPRGESTGGQPGVSGGTKPILFLDALYCTTPSGRRMTGRLARLTGCPGSPRAFRAANPALFQASGFADHPYTQGIYPTMPTYGCPPNTFCWNGHTSDPYYADFAELPRLERTLDHLQSLYGSGRRFAIWNTEFGYWTNPPDRQRHSLPQATAALYMNEAEYLSYSNPRIASYSQYQLYDPSTPVFSSGLLFHNGRPKLALQAFTLPLYLPQTTASHPASLRVWGAARAAGAYGDHQVQIQFAPRGGRFAPVKTVAIGNLRGYFLTTVPFTRSGTVRLAWNGPAGTEYSRTQAVTIR
jgi:hypothetical protein